MSNWDLSAVLLAAAVLVLAMPREDGFLIPERRDWLGWLRRMKPGFRRRRDEAAGYEAERYVTDLRTDRDQSPMTIRQDQLPSAVRRFETPLLSPLGPGQVQQHPPWPTAENPGWTAGTAQPAMADEPQDPPAAVPRRRAPGDPPTIVIEIMRPAVEGDLGIYLAQLPAYTDEDWSAGGLFIPPSAIALGAPDHEGAPHHVDDDGPKEPGLGPLQGGVGDVEGKEEERGKKRPRY